jgi:nucleotide-binding universal stress UspA family protein
MMVFHHILVPIDGSPQAGAALELAMRLASDQGARVTVCTVEAPVLESIISPDAIPNPALDVRVDEEAHALVQRAAERLQAAGVPCDTAVLDGSPVAAIVAAASSAAADLIVMGTHGRSGIARALLGSVAAGVIRMAPVPVLVTHAALGFV